MNNKGFTLVEVLAMLVVLAVILAVTVPNITGILSNQKTNMMVEDSLKMIDDAKTIVSTDNSVKLPSNNNCILLTLNRVDRNSDIVTGPNDNEYDRYASLVSIRRLDRKYIYSVRLVEKDKNSSYYGILNATEDTLSSNSRSYIKKIPGTLPDFNGISNLNDAKRVIGQDGICSSNNLTGFYN